ncbi:MAG: hypothetical protein KOO60_02415 [Gemmatimonadales bacterium]|nr:hypothetical protein [Gemmatimonadales bacterium]
MMHLRPMLSFILVVATSSLAVAASGEPKETIREFVVKPQWSMLQSAEAENQAYYLEPHYMQRGELLGAFVDSTGNVYICDRITDQLIKLNPRGEEVFAIGSLGEGPEDHRGFGELLSWPGSRIARTDCVLPSKIIIYDVDGAFLWDVDLGTQDTLTRLFWNGKYAIGSHTWFDYDPSGTEVKTSLRLLSDDGVEIEKIPMGRIFLDPERVPTMEEMWIYPYVAVSEDGFCFVQQDLYGGRVDCYDQDLDLAWSFDCGWQPVPLTPEEFAESKRQPIFASIHHTIRRMFARRDGEVWIQSWTSEQAGEYVVFEAFGQEGNRLGFIHIFGLPKEAGSWALHGSKVLWIAKGKVDAENANVTIPYISVFDLVAK